MEKKEANFYVLTGDSWTGKSFLGELLLQKNMKECLSFTTREMRSDEELDRYVFLTEQQFKDKKERGHFIESVEYKNNHYALSKYLPKGDCFAIVEPRGRKEILDANIETHNIITVFLKVNKKTLEERLLKRDGNLDRIWDRFIPTKNCLIISWEDEPEVNYNKIINWR